MARDVIVLDMGESPRTRVVLDAIARLLTYTVSRKASLGRLFGLASEPPIVLLLSPGGSAGVQSFPGGAQVVTPLQLLDLDTNSDEVQESALTAALTVASQEFASLFPRESGIPLSLLSRMDSISYLRNGFVLLRALNELLRTHKVRRVRMVSADPSVAEGARRLAEGAGATVHTLVPRILTAAQRFRALAQRPFRRSPTSDPTRTTTQLNLKELPEAVDVLIVSESVPMLRMFECVEKVLLQQNPGMRVLRVQYGDMEEKNPPEARARTLRLIRPDERVPASDVYSRSSIPRSPEVRSAAITSEVLGSTLSLPLADLIDRQYSGLFDRQAEHLAEITLLLDTLRPGVVVVGNDRWWIGQAFVLAAQQRGIPNMLLQDGAANHGAEWQFAVADYLALSSSFLEGRLRPPRGRTPVTTVVGQPRYDSAAELSREAASRRGLPRPKRQRNRVLFATQTMQDFQFVETVVAALLEVDGAEVTIRPHPSEDVRPHLELVNRYRGRVNYLNTDRSFDALSTADILVCQSSTLVIEAALIQVPSVTVNFTGLPDLSPFARVGLADSVNNPAQLTQLVAAILNSDIEYIKRQRRLREGAGLATMVGPVDGMAAQRAAALIARLTEEHSSVPQVQLGS